MSPRYDYEEEERSKNMFEGKNGCISIAAIVALVLAILLVPTSIRIVNQGDQCANVVLGRVTGVSDPGLHIVWPFVTHLACFSTREVVYETSDQPKDSKADFTDYAVAGQTSDGQQISVKYSVRYHADGKQVQALYGDVAENMDQLTERVIKFCTRSQVRLEMQKYEAISLYSGDITAVQNELEKQAIACAEREHIIVTAFVLRKIDFDPDYITAVERKQIAFEGIQTASYEAEQAKQQATGAVNRAEGDAKVAVIAAQASADAQVIQAKAQAESNNLITQSLNDILLQYQYITKLAPNVQTIFVPSGNQFILPLPGK